MKEQWGPEELAEEEPWNSQAFRSMSRRQQNLEIYKVLAGLFKTFEQNLEIYKTLIDLLS